MRGRSHRHSPFAHYDPVEKVQTRSSALNSCLICESTRSAKDYLFKEKRKENIYLMSLIFGGL